MSRLLYPLILGGVLGAASVQAANFPFPGDIDDEDAVMFDFSVGATSDVTLRGYSHARGAETGGTIVAAGFDPVLSLYNGAGLLVAGPDDRPDVPATAASGRMFDTSFMSTLVPGGYTVLVSRSADAAPDDLLSGPPASGPGNTPKPGCADGLFCDVEAENQAPSAPDPLGVGAPVNEPPIGAVPLPAGLPLLLAGLGAFGLVSRRRT